MRGAGIVGAVACLLVLASAPTAHAVEIKVMSTVALAPTLDEVKAKYESTSGNTLTIAYSVIADLKRRIEAGETADVMILSRPALDDLQSQGKVASRIRGKKERKSVTFVTFRQFVRGWAS